ncbi:Arrestin like protein [Argiope bruennichi]|uniref:Arrestin like protein n=1 Tax=Argiope bruennichi TaxID=94029 RepID=A0A8T0EF73_ARGBR|nr:Arrestin like protein [Argiope bruennichi]
MVATCRIYKKACPNGKVTLYLPKREYIDHITSVDPIEGIVLLDDEYLKQRHVYGHVIATFRYGREDDEVMGLKFVKELYLASEQIYPPPLQDDGQPMPSAQAVSKTQQKLMEKLGSNAYPFTLQLPENAPHSVVLQPGPEEQGQPCAIQNADICMFASGHCRTIISTLDTESGCPVSPGGTLHKVVEIYPTAGDALITRGVALDAPIGDELQSLASSTILPEDQEKDPFGIIISYSIKVKLILGALGGYEFQLNILEKKGGRQNSPFCQGSRQKKAVENTTLTANRELSSESTKPLSKKEA